MCLLIVALIAYLLFLVFVRPAWAEDVTVATILENPKLFDGKNVSIIGILAGAVHFEEMPYIYDAEQNKNIMMIGSIAEGTRMEDIVETYGVLSRVRGVYYYDPDAYNYFHSCNHEISRITSIEPYAKEETGSPIPCALQAIMEINGTRKAMLTDLSDGKGHLVAPGINIMIGVLPEEIVAIEPDKIVVEEHCKQCKGSNRRRIEVYLKK